MRMLAVAVLLAACGPTKDGVAVAPLRAGPALIRYEQTRPIEGGTITIRVVAPESREEKVEKTLERAFAERTVDDAGGVLREAGFDDFAVSVSGDAYFAGDAGGEAWRFDVANPKGDRIASIAVRDEGVSAEKDDAATVSIVARDVETASDLGTAALEAGPEAGLALAREKKVDAVYVTSDPYVMILTPGLKGRIEVEKSFTGEVRWEKK